MKKTTMKNKIRRIRFTPGSREEKLANLAKRAHRLGAALGALDWRRSRSSGYDPAALDAVLEEDTTEAQLEARFVSSYRETWTSESKGRAPRISFSSEDLELAKEFERLVDSAGVTVEEFLGRKDRESRLCLEVERDLEELAKLDVAGATETLALLKAGRFAEAIADAASSPMKTAEVSDHLISLRGIVSSQCRACGAELEAGDYCEDCGEVAFPDGSGEPIEEREDLEELLSRLWKEDGNSAAIWTDGSLDDLSTAEAKRRLSRQLADLELGGIGDGEELLKDLEDLGARALAAISREWDSEESIDLGNELARKAGALGLIDPDGDSRFLKSTQEEIVQEILEIARREIGEEVAE